MRGHRSLVAGLMLAVATVGATLYAISPLLPDIAAAFGVPVARAGVLPGAFGVSLALIAPAIGLAAQRLQRARVIVGGLVVFGLAWLAALFVRDFAWLLALTVVAGGATGAVLPAAYAFAAELSAYEGRARVMGRIVSGWSIAILVVVPAMALAGELVDWRWAFGALAIGALALALLIARADKPPHVTGPRPAPVLASLGRVLAHRGTRLVLAANLLDMGALYAVYSFAGTELRRLNDWGASPAGLVVACYGIGLAIVTFNARLIDRWGKKRSAVAALVALGALLSLLPWLAAAPMAMAAGIVIWGLVQGTFFTAITTLATEQIPEMRGVVVALLSGSTYLGVTLYTPITTQLYERVGYWAVGVEAAAGCLLAAALLARIAPDAPGDRR